MSDLEKTMDLFFVGDIHGELKKSVFDLVERYKISDANVIYCGDFGVGFGRPNSINHLYVEVKNRLEKNNLHLWALRGNHDNPDFFDGSLDFPNLHFIQDHKLLTLSGKTIYPVGGGVSIDKYDRIEEDTKRKKKGDKRRCWWPGERVTKKYKDLPSKIDIVISHEAPFDFDPVNIRGGRDFRPGIMEEIIEDRNYLSWVLREIKPQRWYHGHYHRSSSGEYLGTLYRGLDIDEIYMYPNY